VPHKQTFGCHFSESVESYMRKLLQSMKSSVPPSRCALYARVSSADRERGYSIPAQRELLREYAAERGKVIEREFVEAGTAKRGGRGEFEAMLGYLRSNRGCSHILVEKMDRLLRNFQDAAAIDLLGCHIHFVKDGNILSEDCGASEKFMQGMQRACSGTLRLLIAAGTRACRSPRNGRSACRARVSNRDRKSVATTR
jgi:hypothetical protein